MILKAIKAFVPGIEQAEFGHCFKRSRKVKITQQAVFTNGSKATRPVLILLFLVIATLAPGLVPAQEPQSHSIRFETSEGVYGYIKLKSLPQAFGGARLLIQQDNLVIEGIKHNANHYTGNDLAEQGITFPMDCSNCYFNSRGTACMKILSPEPDCASFEICCIHKGGFKKGSGKVEFSEAVKTKHNQASRMIKGTYWENTGYISHIELYDIAGADIGRVLRAAKEIGR